MFGSAPIQGIPRMTLEYVDMVSSKALYQYISLYLVTIASIQKWNCVSFLWVFQCPEVR